MSNNLFVKLSISNQVDFNKISASRSIEIKPTCINKTNVNVRIL